MPTKERQGPLEQWIVASQGPLGPSVSTENVRRVDRITYSANKPAYVSFNTCNHTRGYSTFPTSSVRIPLSPVGTGMLANPVGPIGPVMGIQTRSTSIVTSAYTLPGAQVILTSSEYEARVYDAVLAAYAQARSIPSILQPVIELKDIKQTVKQAHALADWLISRPSSVRKYIRKGTTYGRVVKDFVRSITDKSSNAYLMSVFGILPTVGDASKIARNCADPSRFVKARLNVVPKDTVLKAGFSCLRNKPPFDMSTRVHMRAFSKTQAYGDPYWESLDSTYGLKNYAESLLGDKHWYDVTDIHGLVFIKARVDTSVDTSLLNDWNYTQTPGKILWDLVPFSFVVDWFYNVGDQLQRAERRSNVYRRVRIKDFTEPWVCTHRDRYSLSASCLSRSSLSGLRAWYQAWPDYRQMISGTVTQSVVRKGLRTYLRREFDRGPWQGHLYNLPEQDFSLPVRPYQVAASIALLAQKFLRLGRN